MGIVTFPAAVPGPSATSIVSAERRLLSDLPGVQQARGLQRDYLATQRCEWDLLTPAAAAALQHFWNVALVKGLFWFQATWPLPSGWAAAARRFIDAPRWSHLPGGFWRVDADFELRGRGTPPLYPTIEVDLDGIEDSALTPTVGKVLNDMDPEAIYAVTLPAGRLYTAWSYNSAESAFNTKVKVTTASGTVDIGSGAGHANAAAAYAAYPGATITGSSNYRLWLYDGFPPDNLGGMSLLLTRTN